jgi:hypothetical protein
MMIPALRDVSLILLLTPCLLCLLIPIAVMVGMNWLTRKGRRALPDKLHAAQRGLRKVDDLVDKAGEKIAAPFITAESRSAQVKAQWQNVKRQFSKE